MARAWFLRVFSNSSSFSAIFLSISCLTCPSSSWALRTLFSSASRAPSASSRAAWSSSFSASSLLRCLSSSWMERPPSPSWSRRSLTSSARFLFSRRTMSSCSLASSRAALRRNLSALKLRHSELQASNSAIRSSALAFHSPTTLSKLRPRFSVIMAAAWVRSYSMPSSSSSASILDLDFSGCNLGVEVLNVFLSLLDTRGQLGLATLELINTAKSFNVVLGFPELDLRLGLGQSLESIILLLILLVNAHAEVLSLSHQALVLGEESSTVSGLTISQSLGVLQLGGQRDLVLLEGGDGILALLNLSGQVLGLNLELLLGGISFIESSGKLIKLAISLNNHTLAHLDILLHVGSISHGLLKSRSGFSKISLHTSLVLLRLGLVLVDGVNLLAQLTHAVVVLLPQGSQSSLMGNVGLLQVRLELGKFSFTLLVQFHLESSVGSSLFKPGS